MIRIIVPLAAIAVLVLPAAVEAESTTARVTQGTWSRSDKCNKDAIAKFPDHSSDALAQRERFVRQCNLNTRAPSRAPLSGPAD
jgi:hypothetical protein